MNYLKYMKIRVLLLLTVLSILLCGCKVDYCYLTEICVINNSSYDIEIVSSPHMVVEEQFPKAFFIASNEKKSHRSSTDAGYTGVPYFVRMLIRFGDDVYTLHQLSDGDAYHNFCEESFYEVKQTDKRHRRYTFTFTDEDYEYALANPAPDDVIEEVVGVE